MPVEQDTDLGGVYITVLEEVDLLACAFDDGEWAGLAGVADRLAEAAARLRDLADVATDHGVDGRSPAETFAELVEHEMLADLAELLHPRLGTAHAKATGGTVVPLLAQLRTPPGWDGSPATKVGLDD